MYDYTILPNMNYFLLALKLKSVGSNISRAPASASMLLLITD